MCALMQAQAAAATVADHTASTPPETTSLASVTDAFPACPAGASPTNLSPSLPAADVLEPSPIPAFAPSVQPRPYLHQVGGHGQLIQAFSGSILKPLIPKEAAFYDYINSTMCPESLHWLRSVTPRYYGTRFMRTSNCGTGKVFVAIRSLPTNLDPMHTPDLEFEMDPQSTAAATSDSPTGDALLTSPTTLNPSSWAERMASRRTAGSFAVFPSSAVANTVIVLEDVNRYFEEPSVMDVKIGLRHYDDDATPEKRQRHIAKAKSTTTSTTGVRFIGLQSYKNPNFEYLDKYHGRNLKEKDLVPTLRWFYSNRKRMRKECLAMTLERLKHIASSMEGQRHFNFYSSSLLIVYEGKENLPPRIDVRLIDFAHTQRSNGDLDTGYMFGLRYLIRIFEIVLQDDDKVTPHPESLLWSLPCLSSSAAVPDEDVPNGTRWWLDGVHRNLDGGSKDKDERKEGEGRSVVSLNGPVSDVAEMMRDHATVHADAGESVQPEGCRGIGE